jgi:general secretion pathway protein A
VGQPELDDKLDSPGLRQLKQRVALRSHLTPLDLNETRGYIQRRLRLSGSPDSKDLFPEETVVAVHRHSGGIPRLINTLCENALIAAYSKQAPEVSPAMIDDIAIDFRLGVHSVAVELETPLEEMDLQKAARSLLELYAHLQRENREEGPKKVKALVRPS